MVRDTERLRRLCHLVIKITSSPIFDVRKSLKTLELFHLDEYENINKVLIGKHCQTIN
jgi:hypothetical protein